ncbi:MAG: LysR family transcriptional regulator [Pseudomonadota bacterium]
MYENSSLKIDWDVLQLVLMIDRHGGVSGAARALNVTHATISRRLAKAEQTLGFGIFDRLPAGLKLTDHGQKILAHAADMDDNIHDLERALLAFSPTIDGPLRLTIPPLMFDAALSNDIATFLNTYPDIQFELIGDNNLLNLHQREADIAIRVTDKPPETLWGRKLTDQDAGYYAASDWLVQAPIGQGEFRSELPLISFTAWPKPIPKTLQALCPNIKITARSDDMISALQLVKVGIGITRMPRFVGEATPGLSRIKALPWEAYPSIWLLTHPDLRKAPQIEAFMQFIGQKIAARKENYVAEVN